MSQSRSISAGRTTETAVALSVVILTKNEQLHIARAIESVREYRGSLEVWVVDSYSDDNTTQVATDLGAKVVSHAFTTHARQLAWALGTLPLQGRWTMRIDADEVADKELLESIYHSIECTLSSQFNGLECNRAYVFMGRRLAHGGRSSQRTLRIWRTGYAFVEDRAMDEHVVLRYGRVGNLNGEIRDHNLKGISDFIAKHVSYSRREAYDVLLREIGDHSSSNHSLSSRRARQIRFFKEHVYNRIPGPIAPLLLFTWRYFFLAGLLDGLPGFYYHMLQSIWYRSLVQMQITQARRHYTKLNMNPDQQSLAEYFGLLESRLQRLEPRDD